MGDTELVLGPKMRALRDDRQRAFAWLMAGGAESAAGAARMAGYSDASDGAKVTAHHLMHNASVLDAIEEASRNLLRSLAPLAIVKARAILNDRKHPYHGRMIETVLDRTGHFAKSEHTMRVEHSVDVREIEALALRLARETGISSDKLLGNAKGLPSGSEPRVIEHEPVGQPAAADGGGEASGS